jgi:hypothetical protein
MEVLEQKYGEAKAQASRDHIEANRLRNEARATEQTIAQLEQQLKENQVLCADKPYSMAGNA